MLMIYLQKYKMVNIPKARNTYCAKCNKHNKMKVNRYFNAEDNNFFVLFVLIFK